MKPKLLSKCCQAPLTVSTADEGTSCYVCTSCGRDTDPMFEDKPKLPENNEFTLAEIKQLFSYCRERDREGWYWGNRGYFERRHKSILSKLKVLLESKEHGE